jgi:hypothetical protein
LLDTKDNALHTLVTGDDIHDALHLLQTDFGREQRQHAEREGQRRSTGGSFRK